MPYRKRDVDALLSSGFISRASMPNANLRLAEIVIRQKLFKLESAAVDRVAALYRAAFEDIRQAAETSANVDTEWRNRVLAFVPPRLTRLADAVAARSLEASAAAFTGTYLARLWQVASARGSSEGLDLRVPDALAGVMTENVFDDYILSLLGQDWRAQFADQLDVLTAQIKLAINTGMAEGESMDLIMRRVRNVIGVPTDRRAGFTANFNRVQAITRSVVIRASNNGAIAAYRNNADVVSGYQWLAARDERVCPTCRGLNGTFYKLGQEIRPPAHINCRCAIIPVLRTPGEYDGPIDRLQDWGVDVGVSSLLNPFLTPNF